MKISEMDGLLKKLYAIDLMIGGKRPEEAELLATCKAGIVCGREAYEKEITQKIDSIFVRFHTGEIVAKIYK